MSAITYYFLALKNEIIKLKRTFTIWLAVIFATLMPVINFTVSLFNPTNNKIDKTVNPWDEFISNQEIGISVIISIFIILIPNLITQIEYKSNTLKYLYVQPIPKWSIYFSKLTIIIGTLFFVYFLFFISVLISGFILGTINNESNFLSFSPNYLLFIKNIFKAFVSLLGIIGIQYWLSFRIKNIIFPIAIGMILLIVGIYMKIDGISSIKYFPYAYNIIGNNPKYPITFLYSLFYLILFSSLGYLDIKRLNTK